MGETPGPAALAGAERVRHDAGRERAHFRRDDAPRPSLHLLLGRRRRCRPPRQVGHELLALRACRVRDPHPGAIVTRARSGSEVRESVYTRRPARTASFSRKVERSVRVGSCGHFHRACSRHPLRREDLDRLAGSLLRARPPSARAQLGWGRPRHRVCRSRGRSSLAGDPRSELPAVPHLLLRRPVVRRRPGAAAARRYDHGRLALRRRALVGPDGVSRRTGADAPRPRRSGCWRAAGSSRSRRCCPLSRRARPPPLSARASSSSP